MLLLGNRGLESEKMAEALDFLGSFGWLIYSFILLVICLFSYWYLDSKYPNKTFLVIEKGASYLTKRRTKGNGVYADNLLELALGRERRLIGDLTKFQHTWWGNQMVYLATREKEYLIPLKLEDANLKVEQIETGTRIATAYINVIDETRAYVEKQNELWVTILALLPTAVILGILGLMIYLTLQQFTNISKEVSSSVNTIAKIVEKTQKNETILNVTSSGNSNVISHAS
jgi:hypothetical protein